MQPKYRNHNCPVPGKVDEETGGIEKSTVQKAGYAIGTAMAYIVAICITSLVVVGTFKLLGWIWTL